MHAVAEHSHNGDREYIERQHGEELREIKRVIGEVDAGRFRVKKSREKTMPGRLLYSPIKLNNAFKRRLERLGWEKARITVRTRIAETGMTHNGFREMDFVKDKLGLEIQFGKYAFMVYDILAKMPIFSNRRIIDSGIEVVPMHELARRMSTGVSYFEQVKGDLECRGVGSLDIPVLVIGVDATERQYF